LVLTHICKVHVLKFTELEKNYLAKNYSIVLKIKEVSFTGYLLFSVNILENTAYNFDKKRHDL